MNNKVLQNLKVQKFIQRLYSYINDPSVTDIIWSNNGTSILIPDTETFRKTTMRNISHAKEYTAFLRSLHHYNFIKIKRIEDSSDEYYHTYFVRDRPDLLCNIKRICKKKEKIEVEDLKKEILYVHDNVHATNQNLYNVNEEVINLRRKVEKQEQTINGLIEVLSKAFRIGISSDALQPALISNLYEKDYQRSSNERKKPEMLNNSDYMLNNTNIKKFNQNPFELYKSSNPVFDNVQSNNCYKKRNIIQNNNNLLQNTNNINHTLKKIDDKRTNRKERVVELKSIQNQSMPDLENSKENEEDDKEDFYKDLFF
ncbi:hypothetical protein COBT_003570 [Conglomerata obtusa]